jgi:hypothetical protein
MTAALCNVRAVADQSLQVAIIVVRPGASGSRVIAHGGAARCCAPGPAIFASNQSEFFKTAFEAEAPDKWFSRQNEKAAGYVF